MIKKIDISTIEMAEKVLNIQIPAYNIEAKLIKFDEIPPLKDTLETLNKCGETFFGYFIGNDLVGAVSYKLIGKILDIHRLMVHPDHFRKGIAKELLLYIESGTRDQIVKMIVSTGTKNYPAIHFYEKFGFSKSEERMLSEELSITSFKKILEK